MEQIGTANVETYYQSDFIQDLRLEESLIEPAPVTPYPTSLQDVLQHMDPISYLTKEDVLDENHHILVSQYGNRRIIYSQLIEHIKANPILSNYAVMRGVAIIVFVINQASMAFRVKLNHWPIETSADSNDSEFVWDVIPDLGNAIEAIQDERIRWSRTKIDRDEMVTIEIGGRDMWPIIGRGTMKIVYGKRTSKVSNLSPKDINTEELVILRLKSDRIRCELDHSYLSTKDLARVIQRFKEMEESSNTLKEVHEYPSLWSNTDYSHVISLDLSHLSTDLVNQIYSQCMGDTMRN